MVAADCNYVIIWIKILDATRWINEDTVSNVAFVFGIAANQVRYDYDQNNKGLPVIPCFCKLH